MHRASVAGLLRRKELPMDDLKIRRALPPDLRQLRAAFVELQEHERRLHAGRLPSEEIDDP
jgi:hypothetical protein